MIFGLLDREGDYMTNNDARNYFIESGLKYSDVTKFDLESLISHLKRTYEDYLIDGGKHSQEMGMKVCDLRKMDSKFDKNGKLLHAFIHLDGSYFHRRECISFNSDGFIGFAGWASTANAEPAIKAFKRWCDTIRNRVPGMNIEQGQIWQVVTDTFWSTGEGYRIKNRDAKIRLDRDEYIEIRYPYEWHFRTIDNEYLHAYPLEILKNCRLIGKINRDIDFGNKHSLLQIINDKLYTPIWEVSAGD